MKTLDLEKDYTLQISFLDLDHEILFIDDETDEQVGCRVTHSWDEFVDILCLFKAGQYEDI